MRSLLPPMLKTVEWSKLTARSLTLFALFSLTCLSLIVSGLRQPTMRSTPATDVLVDPAKTSQRTSGDITLWSTTISNRSAPSSTFAITSNPISYIDNINQVVYSCILRVPGLPYLGLGTQQGHHILKRCIQSLSRRQTHVTCQRCSLYGSAPWRRDCYPSPCKG